MSFLNIEELADWMFKMGIHWVTTLLYFLTTSIVAFVIGISWEVANVGELLFSLSILHLL